MKKLRNLIALLAVFSMAAVFTGCGDDDDDDNNNNPPAAPQFAPADVPAFIGNTYNITFANGNTAQLTFPTAGTYSLTINGQTETGNITGLTRNGEDYIATLTPNIAGGNVRAGELRVHFTQKTATTYAGTITTQGAAGPETSNFTATVNTGGTTGTTTGSTTGSTTGTTTGTTTGSTTGTTTGSTTGTTTGSTTGTTTGSTTGTTTGSTTGTTTGSTTGTTTGSTTGTTTGSTTGTTTGSTTGTTTGSTTGTTTGSTTGTTTGSTTGGATEPPASLTGKTLQLTYAAIGGERFDFTSDSAGIYEPGNANEPFTYAWDRTNTRITATRRNLQGTVVADYDIDLTFTQGSGTAGSAIVIFTQPGQAPATDPADFTLLP